MTLAPRRWLGGSVVLVLTMAPLSIASAKPLSEKVTERVVGTGIDEALESLDEPKNQQRLGRVISSAPVRQGMRELVAAMVRGLFDGVDSVIEEQVATARSRQSPQLARELGSNAARGALVGLSQGIEKELGPALARTVERDVGPALARVLETQLMPAVARGLRNPEVQQAIAETTRTITASIVHGGEAALDAEQKEAEIEGDPGVLEPLGGRVALGYAVALFFAFAFGTLLVVLTVLLVRSNRRQRTLTEIGRRREQVLMSMLDSVEAENPTLKTNLERLVKEQLSEHEPP